MSIVDDVQITSAREELLSERDDLLATLAQCRSTADGERPDAPDGMGETEHLSHAEQVELTSRVASMTEEALANVEAALERIEAGTYGTCVGCGGPVGEARLEAIPAAALCVECQGTREAGFR